MILMMNPATRRMRPILIQCSLFPLPLPLCRSYTTIGLDHQLVREKLQGRTSSVCLSDQPEQETIGKMRKEKGQFLYSFYTIVPPASVREGRLMLPEKFGKKFGKDLSDVVVLKVPSGKVWNVQVSEAKGIFWFHNGWREFIEYHCIRAGHLLVFKYYGNSQFHAVIFDMSASEIGYPCDIEHIVGSEHGTSVPEQVMNVPAAAFQAPAVPDKVVLVANKEPVMRKKNATLSPRSHRPLRRSSRLTRSSFGDFTTSSPPKFTSNMPENKVYPLPTNMENALALVPSVEYIPPLQMI